MYQNKVINLVCENCENNYSGDNMRDYVIIQIFSVYTVQETGSPLTITIYIMSEKCILFEE